MNDIDLGYALYLWKTDYKGCFYCSLYHCLEELCPNNCTKDGYYKIIMDDDFKYYNIHEEILKYHPNFGSKRKKKNETNGN